MKKSLLLAVCLAVLGLSAAHAQASLSDSEKAVVITKLLSGDASVLDRVSEGAAPEASLPCDVGCHSMGSNPISVGACANFLSPQACMQAFSSLSCLWSCQ